ncbi:MAG: AMMECR1 domain-containing protein [Geobacteraceae bacterium GWC2_55_20]|nr:MAG: AMMECR1 domain-containing protein [Geobacteraceae bacterium GWC2_55_20]OGU22781.1 MAG: AMMECR1 domain-containing protein [Geobacteraceae bacterium GWF2_54_21]HBA72642.1 AMMECR1 domain-containing protein [Geobacter sp.]HCE69442.1 AMMECR1 domain-containing protein [Geobacter sp.]
MAELLTKSEQKQLLKIARDAVVEYVTCGNVPVIETASAGLNLQSGCFVTIKQKGQLRGCIGNFISDQPLYKLVQEMAVSAATRDPRFYPMKSHDLNDFEIDISVLSPLERISSVDQIHVGTHGIYIVKGSYRGVLLPQVATEYGWNRDQFLRHTCIKAGLPEDAWSGDCDIYIFSALVFGEK